MYIVTLPFPPPNLAISRSRLRPACKFAITSTLVYFSCETVTNLSASTTERRKMYEHRFVDGENYME